MKQPEFIKLSILPKEQVYGDWNKNTSKLWRFALTTSQEVMKDACLLLARW